MESSGGTVREKYQRKFFKVDTFMKEQLKEARSNRSRRSIRQCCSCCNCTETCVRTVRFFRFFITSIASLLFAAAPWFVATAEMTSITVYYFVVEPTSLLVHQPLHGYHYSFNKRLEDVVLLTWLRTVAVVLSYLFGTGQHYQRPYLWTAVSFGGVGIPFMLAKLLFFQHDAHSFSPALTLMLLSLGFSLFHLVAAHRVMKWAKRRYDMGLSGFGYPWEEGEDASLLWHNYQQLSDGTMDTSGDVSPELLADADSKFIDLGRITLHFKEWTQEESPVPSDRGIVLVHGFGGGVFSWRHIAPTLSQRLGCRVVAFDRPGFGLTSRPSLDKSDRVKNNFYSSAFTAQLALSLAEALGLRRVMMIGHSDGALIALMATALSRRGPGVHYLSTQPPPAISLDLQWMGSLATSVGGDFKKMSESLMSPMRQWMSKQPLQYPEVGEGGLLFERLLTDATAQDSVRELQTRDAASQRIAEGEDVVELMLEEGRRVDGGGGGQRNGMESLAQLAPEEVVVERGSTSYAASFSGRGVEGITSGTSCQVVGLGLLHPSLGGEVRPQFAKILGNAKLSHTILRPLLRSEIGEIGNRTAWYDQDKLTKEIIDMYKKPLHVINWDRALIEVCRLKKELSREDREALLADVCGTQCLVITGLHDRICPPSKADAISSALATSRLVVIPETGHLSLEESPLPLLDFLIPFCSDVLLTGGGVANGSGWDDADHSDQEEQPQL